MSEFFLGIDVSKGYADFILIDSQKKIVEKNFQLDDTFQGHNFLFSFLQSFFLKNPDANIITAVESTGGYENNWVSFIAKLKDDFPIRVTRLNPFGVSHSSKADLKRVITDKISALTIAEYVINHRTKISFVEEDYFAPLRKQWIYIKLLVKQKVQLYNQLEALLYTANPELISYCKHGTPNWVLVLLKQYPSAKSLAKASPSVLARIPYITRQRAETIISNAKLSVASQTDPVTCALLKSVVKQIISLDKTIKAQENELTRCCSIPEVKLLQ